MSCHALLQGIFPTQALNPHLLHWQVDSLPLSYQGSPSEFLKNMEKCVSSNLGSFQPLFVEILVFLFSPFDSPDIYVLLHLMETQKCLRFYSFLVIIFKFCLSDWIISTNLPFEFAYLYFILLKKIVVFLTVLVLHCCMGFSLVAASGS